MTDTKDTKDTKAPNVTAQLIEAARAFSVPTKNKVNPFTKSRYADLPAIMSAVRPALLAQGLMLTHRTEVRDGILYMTTSVVNANGESIGSGDMAVCPVTANPQQLGSALTYVRRYQVCALLAIAAEDDDDANVAEAAARAEQRTQIDPALRTAAQDAANSGLYREFWSKLNNEQKKALVESGLHAKLKGQ